MKAQEIIDCFIRFFESYEHKYIDDFPLSINDPTLLFVNSGMAPLKNYFLGNDIPPSKALVACQSCLRVGGKHNDIRNIGNSARHHTFFQMLGNFSFGAYSRTKALEFALEFLQTLQLKNLWFTHHIQDTQAHDILHLLIEDKNRIISLSNDDNKWSMGKYGPFGYSIEIFYSTCNAVEYASDGGLSNNFLEIWNIVYMTHEMCIDDVVKELNIPCIDTGMGLERVCAILQGYTDTYLTDIFDNYFNILGKYMQIDRFNPRQRIIVDHTRSVKALLKEHIIPSATSHGYILRMLIRKIIVNIYMLNKDLLNNILCDLFDSNPVILSELSCFINCIESGMHIISESNTSLSCDQVFKLYETYGIPIEVTEDILSTKFDQNILNTYIEQHKELSRSSNMQNKIITKIPNHITEFIGYTHFSTEATVIDQVYIEGKYYIIMNKTPFYPESGGQESDTGYIQYNRISIDVVSVIKIGNTILHQVMHEIPTNIHVHCNINMIRRLNLSKAHSATHITNHILRQLYNTKQSGSLVKENEFRLDIICSTDIDIKLVEQKVNNLILLGTKTCIKEENTKLAIQSGAVFLACEKYPDISRVVNLGDSHELCCGTHVGNTTHIEYLVIYSIKSIAANVKRIEAYVSSKAYEYINRIRETITNLSNIFSTSSENILYRVETLRHEYQALKTEYKKIKKSLVKATSKTFIKDNIQITFAENGSSEELLHLIDENYNISIVASKDSVIMKGNNMKITQYISSMREHFIGQGGGNDRMFRGSYNIINCERLLLWLDKISLSKY